MAELVVGIQVDRVVSPMPRMNYSPAVKPKRAPGCCQITHQSDRNEKSHAARTLKMAGLRLYSGGWHLNDLVTPFSHRILGECFNE